MGLIIAATVSPIFNSISSALRRVITLSMMLSPTLTDHMGHDITECKFFDLADQVIACREFHRRIIHMPERDVGKWDQSKRTRYFSFL